MKEKRNLILTLLGSGVSGLGTNLYTFAISFYILSVTGSANSFALSLILSTLPRVILNPISGNFVDRFNRKIIVILADTLSGLLMFALFALTAGNNLSLTMIYAATFSLSVCQVFLGTAFSASYGAIVTKKFITKLNSYNQTISAMIQIGAPVLGGMVYALVDIRLFILLNGISFIISAFTETFIDFKFNSTLKDQPENTNSFMKNFKEGFDYVRSKKMYISLAVYALILNFFLSSFNVIMPYTLITIHEFDPHLVGYIEAAFPIGMLIASIIVGKLNIEFSKELFSNSIFFFAGILVVFSLPSLHLFKLDRLLPFYYGLTFILLSANAISVNVPLGVKFQTSVDEGYRGRFFGFLGMMSEGVIPISYLLCGFLINILPTYVILYVSSIALIGISFHVRANNALDDEIHHEEVIQNV